MALKTLSSMSQNCPFLQMYIHRHPNNSDLAFHEPFDGFHFIVSTVSHTFATMEKMSSLIFICPTMPLAPFKKIPYIMRILLSKKTI
jgi:hypothetical protein